MTSPKNFAKEWKENTTDFGSKFLIVWAVQFWFQANNSAQMKTCRAEKKIVFLDGFFRFRCIRNVCCVMFVVKKQSFGTMISDELGLIAIMELKGRLANTKSGIGS